MSPEEFNAAYQALLEKLKANDEELDRLENYLARAYGSHFGVGHAWDTVRALQSVHNQLREHYDEDVSVYDE